MSEADPTVFVVDDEPSVLKALARLFRSAGLNVAVFASPREFLDTHDPNVPGCLVLDVSMPGFDGLELQRTLGERGAGLPIIFLTGRADVPMSVSAMKRGAVDFLTKPADEYRLLEAVKAAIAKDRIGRQARAEVAEIRRRIGTLTPREHEVFELVVAGKLNKQIAVELGAAEKTVKVHRGRVMEKMHAESLAELVHLAERVGVSSSRQQR
ncbi:MAG: response regulator transcription factor [Tepidisphaeraceae bacterium]